MTCKAYITLDQAIKFSIVFNSRELNNKLYVKLDHMILNDDLYDIIDISKSTAKTISFDNVEYYQNHIWIDVPWKNLDRTNGLHMLRFGFMRENTHHTYRYFSYIVQDDNPQKDYIYMNDRYLEYDEDKQGKYIEV